VKKWSNVLVLGIGLALMLASAVVYGIHVVQSATPAANVPLIQQYSLFLWLFLPGLTLLAIYGTIGVRRPDNPVGLIPKFILVLILLTNTITILTYTIVAPGSKAPSEAAFWTFLAVAILGLADFGFSLVVWNGLKWGYWCLCISAFLMFVLKFAGSVPIVPSVFELSAVAVLFIFLRPIWQEMD